MVALPLFTLIISLRTTSPGNAVPSPAPTSQVFPCLVCVYLVDNQSILNGRVG